MRRVEVIQGDITKLDVDAIVNAANPFLGGGGGVDGAIHKAGGPQILKECEEIREREGQCSPGNAVITSGGNLKARYVIHAVGPIWRGGEQNEDELLASAYKKSLTLAVKNDIKSLAFPNISTGVYGFPKGRAAEVATKAVREFLNDNNSINTIIFCCYDDENFKIYKSILDN